MSATPQGTAVDRLATGESGTYYGLSAAIALYHEHYGCMVCGHRGPECTPTLCRTEARTTMIKLTDTQERALTALGTNYDLWVSRGATKHGTGYGDGFTLPMGVRESTLEALKKKGMVETRERPTCTVGRITEAGRSHLRARA